MPNEPFRAFMPADLPPTNPSLVIDGQLPDALEKANRALGRLDGLALIIPDLQLFLFYYVRKEAVLSSQVEGTQSSLSDLLSFESKIAGGAHQGDVTEVSNYVRALEHGLGQMRQGKPLTVRLLREVHEVLLADGRGSEKEPGEFRRSQNWVGGSRPGNAIYVPPPPNEIAARMGALERFWHNDPEFTPSLIKAALVHVQFETIHPFLDGNGRLGRLLIPMLLCYEGALSEPLLYLSLYFKRNRSRYYDHLQSVRTEGDWESWLLFFLTGVRETAEQATQTAQRVHQLVHDEQAAIEGRGRSASAFRLHRWMQRNPFFTIAMVAEALRISIPAATSAIRLLVSEAMVEEVTGKRRGQSFAYRSLLNILIEGTDSAPG